MHQLDINSVFKELNTTPQGLSSEEAKKRIDDYGLNKLVSKKTKSIFFVFLNQINDLLVIILIISAAISFFLHDIESSLVIISVILLNAILGTIEFYRSNRSLKSLKTFIKKTTTVLRDGKKAQIKTEEVVPGDIAFYQSGDIVTADGRIIEAVDLQVKESSLTGESDSVIKAPGTLHKDTPLSERSNSLYSGSLVLSGSAKVAVVKTGNNTEIGLIASLINRTKNTKTPLQTRLDSFSKVLALVIIIIAFVIFLINLERGVGAFDSMMFAISLAVAAIPEALGSIVTITITLASEKMAKKNTIVKDPKVLEALGSVSVLCTDKTGTLTKNKMEVVQAFSMDYAYKMENCSDELLIKAMHYCQNAFCHEEKYHGNATDIAILEFTKKKEITKAIRKEEIPFSSERRMMSVIMDDGCIYTKGALESILAKTTYYLSEENKLDYNLVFKIKRQNDLMASQGLRTIAIAYQRGFLEEGLIFLGLIGLLDSPKESAYLGILNAKKAHVNTIMITGDQRLTAEAVGQMLGFEKKETLDGLELEKMSDSEFAQNIHRYNIYSRITPELKLRIVSHWQQKNAVVLMVGDGVNDAPALKKADIGITMGIEGTEVSKEASDIVLVDDNFNTIISAITSGRSIYLNISNAIAFLISGNMAGIIVVFYAAIFHLPMPFSPEHLLFINLVTDSIPAIAIGMMKENEDLINHYPRKRNSIMSYALWRRMILEGLLMGIVTIIAFYLGYKINTLTGMTMAFSTLCLARLYHGFNSTTKGSIFRYGIENEYSIYALLVGLALLVIVLFIPFFMDVFDIAFLTLNNILYINALSLAPTIIIQIYKYLKEGSK